jgi:hypothetical protein
MEKQLNSNEKALEKRKTITTMKMQENQWKSIEKRRSKGKFPLLSSTDIILILSFDLRQFGYRVVCQVRDLDTKIFCGFTKHDVDHCYSREDLVDVLDRSIKQVV